MVNTYTSLHVHSEYSSALLGFTDSIIRIPEALQWCYNNGLRGMSISDHEGISGFVEMELAVEKMDLQRPFRHIFANEIYLISEEENAFHETTDIKPRYWHFLLNCLDETGLHMMYELSSRAWLRSYVYRGLRRRPTFYSDIEEIIGQNQGHIVGSTACLGGYLPHLILNNDRRKIKQFIQWGVKTFGTGNFFLECQPCLEDNEEQTKVNKALWDLHEEMCVPIIVTTDAHYLEEKDRLIHKAYLNSKDGGDTREADAFYMTAHLFSPTELRETLRVCFNDEQIDVLFQTTNKIADRVQPVTLKKTTQVPALPEVPEFNVVHKYKSYYAKYPFIKDYANSVDEYERYYYSQIEKGLMQYEETHKIDIEQYLAQINLEMEQVKGLGNIFDNQRMCDYFTVVQKVIDLIWTKGDSLVGIGRGSAGCYLTNFLLHITGIDPQRKELQEFYPWWRFCSTARSDSIFDIDIDIESFNKEKIIQAIKDYFGERRVCQVVTWGRLSARTAIERACRGLNIPSDTAAYLRSLVPIKRGKIYSLNDCLYGNKELGREKVPGFAKELKKYDGLLETAQAFEGLIISSGVHAGALNVLKSDFTDTGALMVSSNGAVINQYDLHMGEITGQLKFDLLSIDALCSIRGCLNLLLKNNKIQWQGSLRKTYNYYLGYDVLEKDNKEMWDLLPHMPNSFQFDSRAGKEALLKIKAQNLIELTLANGLMRLAVAEGEQPMDKYVRYRNNINEWYIDMTDYGIPLEEQNILKELLKPYCGLMISQATTMSVLMDKRVCNFTLKEADKARKAIAKKNAAALAETEERLYKKGVECGRSQVFLDYLWKVQIEMSKSYAFDFSHSHEYATECLQELNLYYKYPQVYWNTAVVIAQSQSEDTRENVANTTDYGKIAQSIYKAKSNGISVEAPSITQSDLAFTPIEENNTILYGLAAISGINSAIAQQIIANRPYTSFKDFYLKNSQPGTLITPSKFRQLIKGGCFDCFSPDRVKVMKYYIMLSTTQITALTMANLPAVKSSGIKISKEIIAPYNFYKYVTSKQFFYGNHPKFKSKKIYWLDGRALKYFNNNCKDRLHEGVDYWQADEYTVVVDKSLEKVVADSKKSILKYINEPDFLKAYSIALMKKKYMEFIDGNESPEHWSFQALSFYSQKHELANLDLGQYNISHFSDLPEEPIFTDKTWGNRSWKQYEISAICGTLIARNDNNHILNILTVDNEVVSVKMQQGAFAWYKQTISETIDGKKNVLDPSWLDRGALLIVAGYRRGQNDFVAKKYKNSIFNHQLQRIWKVNEDGSAQIQSSRYEGDETNEGY